MINQRSAGIVIYRYEHQERLYLLLHYAQGHWDFSKGMLEPDESDEQAARRELKEETGIEELELDPDFSTEIGYTYEWEGDIVHKTVRFFLGETQTKHVLLSFEHKGHAWLSYGQARDKLTFATAKEVLEKAQNYLEEAQ